jgi:AraC family transcriptional regulator of arabinose operon
MRKSVQSGYTGALQLLAGHFHEGSGYRIVRREGVGDWLLIATLDGKGRFGHAGGDLIAEPGDWVLIRPGTFHDYGVEASLRRWDLLWVHFQPRAHWLPWLNWPSVAPGLMRLTLPKETENRFREVHRYFTGDLHRREAYAMNALEAMLLDCDRHNPLASRSRYDERVQRAMDYLERNFNRRTTLADVASAAGLSASRLSHLFREQTAQTPQHYLETVRMRYAAELLERTGFSVKQIADAVGYESAFYFSLRFKERTTFSPTSYRARRGRSRPPG